MFAYAQPQRVCRGLITVPVELRAALGLHDGCVIHVSQSWTTPHLPNEFVVSAIPLERRGDLWRLDLRCRDRPGLLNDVTSLLNSWNLVVLGAQASVRTHEDSIAIGMDLDATLYASELDGTNADRLSRPGRTLDELGAALLARFALDLCFRLDGTPHVSLQRHHQLRLSTGNIQSRADVVLKNGVFQLPAEQLAVFTRQARTRWPTLDPDRDPLIAVLVAEPAESLLSVFLYYRNTDHIHLRVSAPTRGDMHARLTSELRKSGFNILQAYSRQVLEGERVLVDLLLHLPIPPNGEHCDGRLRRFARRTLQGGELSGLGIRVFFPRPTGPARRSGGNGAHH